MFQRYVAASALKKVARCPEMPDNLKIDIIIRIVDRKVED